MPLHPLSKKSLQFRLPPIQMGPAHPPSREAGKREPSHSIYSRRLHTAGSMRCAQRTVLQRLDGGDRGPCIGIECKHSQRRMALHVDDGFPVFQWPRRNAGGCHPPGIGQCSQESEQPLQCCRARVAPGHKLSGPQDSKSDASNSTNTEMLFTCFGSGKPSSRGFGSLEPSFPSAQGRPRGSSQF